MLSIDRLAYGSGFKKLNPHMRIGVPILWMVAIQLINSPILYSMTFVVAATATLWHKVVPARLYLKALLVPAFFVVTALLGIIFVSTSNQTTPLWHGSLGIISLYVTEESLKIAVLACLRAFSSVTVVYFVVFNTPIWEIGVYMKRLKISATFVELFILCYRFLFVLLDEATSMAEAQVLRLGYSNLKLSFQSLSLLIGQLLIRSLLRAKSMEDSLNLRLYDGQFHMD